jgi:hypothetical protein
VSQPESDRLVRRQLSELGRIDEPHLGRFVASAQLSTDCAAGEGHNELLSDHLTARPVWTCVVCGDDYPCATRRAQLLEEFRGASVQFATFMSIDFLDAVADPPDVPPGELHARFFWFRDGQQT